MKPGTYREAFEEHLQAVLARSLPETRRKLFSDWLRVPFGLEECGELFVTNADVVGEEDPIVCDKCAGDVQR